MKAAYLGPKASFSHQAALHIFPPSSPAEQGQGQAQEVDVQGVPTFADIFDGVQSSRFGYGVIPFENSSSGSVVQSLDLLADRGSEYQDIKVCAEYCLPVHHYLLVKNDDALARRTSERLDHALKHVEKFYTHPQVWGQCPAFLSRTACRSIARQDCASTSEAARIVSQSAAGTCAAIASDLAAVEYGLTSLADNIEDVGDNTTRFFVLARTDTPPLRQRGDSHENGAVALDAERLYKNLVSFTIDHKSPGALAEALSVFKKYDLNLTSINTRPSRLRPWHYIFLAECEQVCRRKDGIEAMDTLTADLGRLATRCRHLGMWEDRLTHTVDVTSDRV